MLFPEEAGCQEQTWLGRCYTRMVYFFDTFDGNHWTQDETGFEASDLEAARKMAQDGLADMARGSLPNRRFVDLAVRIRTGPNTVGVVKMVHDAED